MTSAAFVALVDSIDLTWFPLRPRLSAKANGKKVQFKLLMRGGRDVREPSKRMHLQYTEDVDVWKFTRARALSWIRQTLLNGLGHELDECLGVVTFTRP